MTNWNRFPFLLLAMIALNFSCNHETPKEAPEEIDNPELRKITGGTPDESTTTVSGSFKSTEMNCVNGFGLCDLEFLDPKTHYSDTTKKIPSKEKKYKAIFYLSTSSDTLRIEFDESVPHFEEYLTVGKGDTIRNFLGHEYIVPVKGKYKATKATAYKFGRVEIKVVKGKEKSSYPVNPKDSAKKKTE